MGTVISSEQNTRTTVNVYREDGSSTYTSFNESVYQEECLPFELSFSVSKAASSDEGLVSGWANVAMQADGTPPLDWQDDIIRSDVLEKAAINFMMDYRSSGVMHTGEAKGVVVESIVFTKEKQAAIGIPEGVIPEGWFITVKVLDPEVFELVKGGVFKMFSIHGKAKRIKL